MTKLERDNNRLLKRVKALEKALRDNMEFCRDYCRGTGTKRGGNDSGPCKWPPCIKARKLVGSHD